MLSESISLKLTKSTTWTCGNEFLTRSEKNKIGVERRSELMSGGTMESHWINPN
jgi:hypothetical protein